MDYDAIFKESLDIGLKGEALLKLIAEAYVARGESAVEVKNDQLVSETGNVYIERESREKASGIDASNSPYWAIVLDGDKFKREVIVIIKTERLREICQHSDSGDVPGGDSDTSRGYLIHPEELVKSPKSIRKPERKMEMVEEKARPHQLEIFKEGDRVEMKGPCFICGSSDWWQRPDGGCVCGRCHPKPREKYIGKEPL